MQFSPQQDAAFATAVAWLRIKHAPFFYLAGYAGTGKSTIAEHIAGQERGKVVYAAMTGRAAKVMRSKGCKGASTIHSLIYHAEDDPTGKVVFTLSGAKLRDVSLIIIDECSMVGEEMGRDLLSFGIPVLALGDPGQLPPVSGAGFFTSGKPNYMLTEIHRQAADSPIIQLATSIREGRFDRREISVPA